MSDQRQREQPGSIDARPSLVEREGEQRRLRVLVSDAVAGHGGALSILGEAGLGKTAMLSVVAGEARRAGMTVATAEGNPLRAEMPLALASQLLDALLQRVGIGLLERHGIVEAPRLRDIGLACGQAATEAAGLADEIGLVRALIGDLASEEPLALIVDDCQWSDGVSARLLAELAAGAQGLPLAVCLASTEGGAEDSPAHLASLGGVAEMRLRPLGREAVAEVAGADPSLRLVDVLHAQTEGNPFLLNALLTQAPTDAAPPAHASDADDRHRRDCEVLAEQSERGDRPELIRSVAAWVQRRGRLQARLASAVAILGEASVATAARLAELEAEQARAAAEELAHAGILASATPLRLRHPVLERLLALSLQPVRRAAVHRRAAELLREIGAEEQRIVPHLLRCEPAGDPWAREVLWRAAEAARRRGDPDAAASALLRALDEGGGQDARAELQAELAAAQAATGRSSGVEPLRQAVSEADDPAHRAALRIELGETLCLTGEISRGIDELEDALAELDAGGDDELQARALSGLASYGRLYAPTASRTAAQLERGGSPSPASTAGRAALAGLATHRLGIGAPVSEVIATARRAVTDGSLMHEGGPAGMPFLMATYTLSICALPDEAEALLERALALAASSGSVRDVTTVLHFRSLPRLIRGDLAAAAEDAETVLERMAGIGAPLALLELPARFALATCRLHQGDLEGARGLIEIEVPAPVRDTQSHSYLLCARAALRLAEGDLQRALQEARACGDLAERLMVVNPAVFPWRSFAAIALDLLGDGEAAKALAEEQLAAARRFGAPHAVGAAMRALAAVDRDRRVDLLCAAVKQLAGSAARLEVAECCSDLGCALRRAGRRSEARRRLEEALDLADRCGASVVAGRVRGELRILGARPRRARIYGAEALTVREREVCELAAAGLTNPQIAGELIVSANTVATHLRHAYAKLGIDARGEIAGALEKAR